MELFRAHCIETGTFLRASADPFVFLFGSFVYFELSSICFQFLSGISQRLLWIFGVFFRVFEKSSEYLYFPFKTTWPDRIYLLSNFLVFITVGLIRVLVYE